MSTHNSRNGPKQIFEAAMVVLKGEHTPLTESANRLLQRRRIIRKLDEGVDQQRKRTVAEAANALSALWAA